MHARQQIPGEATPNLGDAFTQLRDPAVKPSLVVCYSLLHSPLDIDR